MKVQECIIKVSGSQKDTLNCYFLSYDYQGIRVDRATDKLYMYIEKRKTS